MKNRGSPGLPSLPKGPKSKHWLHFPDPESLNCHFYTGNDVCVGPSDTKDIAGNVSSAASWENFSSEKWVGPGRATPVGPAPSSPVTFPAGRSNVLCGGHQINFSERRNEIPAKWLAFLSFLRCHTLPYSFSFRKKGHFVILCQFSQYYHTNTNLNSCF